MTAAGRRGDLQQSFPDVQAFDHRPVLLQEAVRCLRVIPEGVISTQLSAGVATVR